MTRAQKIGVSFVSLVIAFAILFFLNNNLLKSPMTKVWGEIALVVSGFPLLMFFIFTKKKHIVGFAAIAFTLCFGLIQYFSIQKNLSFELELIMLLASSAFVYVGLAKFLSLSPTKFLLGSIFIYGPLMGGVVLTESTRINVELLGSRIEAKEFRNQKKYDEAIALLQKAYQKGFFKEEILQEIASIEEEQHHDQKAIKVYELLRKKTHIPEVELKLASLYYKKGDDQKALRSLASVVSKNPNQDEGYKALINLFIKRSEFDNAYLTAKAWSIRNPKSEAAKKYLQDIQNKYFKVK